MEVVTSFMDRWAVGRFQLPKQVHFEDQFSVQWTYRLPNQLRRRCECAVKDRIEFLHQPYTQHPFVSPRSLQEMSLGYGDTLLY